jgi:DNA-binding HxlR family transcriptional regulator
VPRASHTRSRPIERAIAILADRWTLLIIKNALGGTTRYIDFRTSLNIPDTVLTARLSALVMNALMVRVFYRDGRRGRYEYQPTRAAEMSCRFFANSANGRPLFDPRRRPGMSHRRLNRGAFANHGSNQ